MDVESKDSLAEVPLNCLISSPVTFAEVVSSKL